MKFRLMCLCVTGLALSGCMSNVLLTSPDSDVMGSDRPVQDVSVGNGLRTVLLRPSTVFPTTGAVGADGLLPEPRALGLMWIENYPHEALLYSEPYDRQALELESASITINGVVAPLDVKLDPYPKGLPGARGVAIPLDKLQSVGTADTATIELTAKDWRFSGDLLGGSFEKSLRSRLTEFMALVATYNGAVVGFDGSSLSRQETKDWPLLLDGATVRYLPVVDDADSSLRLSNGAIVDRALWVNRLKPLIEALPAAARDPALSLLVGSVATYSPASGAVEIEPGERKNNRVTLTGEIRPRGVTVNLRLQFFGDQTLDWDRFTVRTDGDDYESPVIAVGRRPIGDAVWEFAPLPLSNADYRALADRIVHSNSAHVKLKGPRYVDEAAITGHQKIAVLKALTFLDAMNAATAPAVPVIGQ